MNFKEEVLRELDLINNAKFDESNTLTNNAYFLDNDILLKENKCGDARIPFTKDGLALWVHQNGNISLNESNFFLISEALECDNNFFAFFLGEKEGDEYLPTSLFEVNKNIFEKDVTRYTIFKNSYAIFILIHQNIIYALRLGLTDEKDFIYEVEVINNSKEEKDLYSSMYLNFNLMHSSKDSVETKWFREAKYDNDLFTLNTVEDVSPYEHIHSTYYLKRNVFGKTVKENTTSRGVYSNGKTSRFDNSECLLLGKFLKEKHTTRFNDFAICGDILKFHLKANESLNISYILSKDLNRAKEANISGLFTKSLQNSINYYENENYLKMKFNDSDVINPNLFTKFIDRVIYQVDYCARTKNSTLTMLGIRDIFQAIEAGLIWNKEEARRKILEALNFTNINGRLPRQYSLPAEGQNYAKIDAREFIDSGLWVIDTIYQYLAYTKDESLLNEECGYINIVDSIGYIQEKKDTVLKHLYLIIEYLIDNIDSDTHCLKILYGDWNDAVDGLGKSLSQKGFTNGVSVMATFQLYSSLTKIIDIIDHYDKDNEVLKSYFVKKKEEVAKGLKDNAFVKKEERSKILHGWGENKSFFVGSFDDVDKKERDSLTSNAFYINSDFYKFDSSYANGVIDAYHNLDSKYGLLTFKPGFEKDAAKVGRIVNLPLGTAENGAVYIHGACFAIDSLFTLGQDKFAWDEIFKIIPITHKFVSTTPFIMPNSYGYNESIEVDGESMNDWFTGSSSTLIKLLIRNVFGIKVTLDNLIIQPACYFPFKQAEIDIQILNTHVHLKHISDSSNRRVIKINGETIKDLTSEYFKKDICVLPIEKLNCYESLEIEVLN